MANNVKRIINEQGIVLSKYMKKATDGFKAQDGRIIAAQPDRYFVKVASSYKIDEVNGLEEVTILDYKVDATNYNKFKYQQTVNVAYEFNTYRLNPISVEPAK